jgi:hypothetical protein
MRTKLDETLHFIRLYVHAQGKSEVPSKFHIWSCISLIAACVADRVYVRWMKAQPISPNLYVFLVAPSGIGKDVATNCAANLITWNEVMERTVNYYRGKLTPPRLHDILSEERFNKKLQEYDPINSKIWLVTPELTYGMGKGEMAEQLIETMTALFSSGKTTLREGTRTKGELMIEDPCINWLAGTTKEWLVDAVKPKGIKSGFWARVIPVYHPASIPVERLWAPIYPPDYDVVIRHLRARAQGLTYLQGEFEITAEADSYGRQWYFNRPDPGDDNLAPYFNRAREMVMKLAMVFALADGGKLVIDAKHIQLAHSHYKKLQDGALELIELASCTPQTADTKTALKYIEKSGTVTRTRLLRQVYPTGMDKDRLNKAVSHLMDMKLIVKDLTETGGIVYLFKGA